MSRQHNACLDCCLAFFAPPYAILVHSGDCGPHFWINMCLCVCTFYIGGIIHAYWFCFCRVELDDTCGGGTNNINISLNNQTNVGAPTPQVIQQPVYGAPVQPMVQPTYVAAAPAQPMYAPNQAPPTYEQPKC
ncbi:hypothetical protein QR680_018430 [Steinernema hermaphroditum]|uniref:Uncharacterized protein n=1 Tax=Steinernema hermaphroditum TaxID=289476 RepID=A0AA39HIV3_9BILA|nr:hypothetical protein QR680_018430 [Steinernema hermaphroditum]